MIKYILSLTDEKTLVKSLPVKGTYTTKINPDDKGQGVYIFRAAYKDHGALGLAGLASEDEFVLRNPNVGSTKYDVFADVNKMSFNGMSFVMVVKNGSYIGLNKVDLTGIAQLEVAAVAPKNQVSASGGVVEVHLDQPQGKLVGKSEFIGDVPGGGFNAKPYAISLESTEGVHDLYLVFQNANMGSAQVMMIVFGTQFKMEGETNAVAPALTYTTDELSAFTGKYKMTGLPFPYIEMSVKDGKLVMDAGGQAGLVQATSTKDKFDASGRAMISFVRDNQKVTKLVMEAMGFKFEGVKE
jgi:cytochrome c